MPSFKQLLKRTTSFQTKHPYVVLFLIVALTIFMYGGYSQVQTVASLEQMMPRDIEEIDAYNNLRDAHMGQDMVAVIVRMDRDSTDPLGHTDVRDYEVARYINHLSGLLDTEPDILQTYAYTDLVPKMIFLFLSLSFLS